MIAYPDHTIVISPIGNCDPGNLMQISDAVQHVFGFRTETARLINDIHFALNQERNQYHSTLILEKLAHKLPFHATKVIGITDVDLFIPILTYVYGEAQLGGISSIISIRRLGSGAGISNPDRSIHARIVKEVIHELGHTFKLRHCPDKTCIMHYCRCIDDVDQKSDKLCRHCGILLDDEIKRLTSKKPGPKGAISLNL